MLLQPFFPLSLLTNAGNLWQLIGSRRAQDPDGPLDAILGEQRSEMEAQSKLLCSPSNICLTWNLRSIREATLQ